MGTIVTVPIVSAPTENFPVLNVANGIVPDEALAITCNLQFSPTAQAILIDLTESARKFSTIPIQGAFVDMSGSTIDMRLENPASGQSILAKASLQGYYNLLSPMPQRFIAVLASAPASNLNITVIFYNTVIESEVWGLTSGPAGPAGPQGPPGPTGATGPQGPAGPAGVIASVQNQGTLVTPARAILNFNGAGVTATDDSANGRTNITIPGYVLPAATASVIGGVKTGTNVAIAADGTISVPPVAAFQTPWLSNINGAGFNLVNTGLVGVGITTPLYQLDVHTGGAVSQLHLASSAADTGAYLLSSGDSNAFLMAGVTYNGTNYIAKAPQASAVAQSLGGFTFFTDSGLTAGNAYTPTTRMAIDTTGHVGIGPGGFAGSLYLLDVRANNSAASQLHLSNTTADAGGYLGATAAGNFNLSAGAAFDGTNWIAKATFASAIYCYNGIVQFGCDTGLTVGATYTPTPRMAITPTGVALGTGTAPTHQLELSLDSAAKPTTNTWTISSGAKVKRKVKRLKGGLDIINKLSPTEAEYNGKGGTPEGQRVVSLIAEEVREILPHTVTEDKDGNLGFNVHEVIHHLILAVQQLSKKLEAMEGAA